MNLFFCLFPKAFLDFSVKAYLPNTENPSFGDQICGLPEIIPCLPKCSKHKVF